MSPELLQEFLFLIFSSIQVNRTNEQLPVIAPCGTGLHVISVSKKWDCFVFLPRTNQKDVTGLSDEDHTVWCRAVLLEIPVVIKDLEAVPEDSDDICSISILPAYPFPGHVMKSSVTYPPNHEKGQMTGGSSASDSGVSPVIPKMRYQSSVVPDHEKLRSMSRYHSPFRNTPISTSPSSFLLSLISPGIPDENEMVD